MTDKKSRRVMIFNNIKSDTIDQAIFILKSTPFQKGNTEVTAAGEAQEIINSYVHRVERIRLGKHNAKKARGKAVFFTLLSLGLIISAILVVYLNTCL